MERKTFTAMAVLGLALLFAGGLSLAQGPAPQGAAVTFDNPGTAFSYQGRLQDSSGPLNGTCDFRFGLFDAAQDGAQLGGTQSHGGVPLDDGYFTIASLDFGPGAIDGQARWLQIEVRCPAGDGSYTPLSPRQALRPAPLALALPGLWTEQRDPWVGPNLVGGYSLNWVTDGVWGATIGGGGEDWARNRVTDNLGTVSGGTNNQAGNAGGSIYDGELATVGGGVDNQAQGAYSTVGGGMGNTTALSNTTVAGGAYNNAAGDTATIGGGAGNQALGTLATVAGGGDNVAGGEWNATVGGGYDNVAASTDSTVGGGNTNEAGQWAATVAGGYTNRALGNASTIGGGSHNTAQGDTATIGGGYTNTVTATLGTIAGGEANLVTADHAAIGGGYDNEAAGSAATVGGGYGNAAPGAYATVAGGTFNLAEGNFSMAAGNRARAVHDGAFVWADHSSWASFSSQAENEFRVRAYGGADFETDGAGLQVDGSDVWHNGNVARSQPPAGNVYTPIDAANNKLSITIGPDGMPLIAYTASGELRLVHCLDLACTTYEGNQIESNTCGADWPTVLVGADGLPFIAYYCGYGSVDELRSAHCGDLACDSADVRTLDNQDDAGKYASATIGGDGLPFVAYQYQSGGYTSLRAAHCLDVACHNLDVRTVDGDNAAGFATSVILGIDGYPTIAYVWDDTTQPNAPLKVAHCFDYTCTTNTRLEVDGSGNMGYTSITLGVDGRPLVAYTEDNSEELRVAHCDDYVCGSATLTTLEYAVGNVGGRTSLTIGSDDLPILSYFYDGATAGSDEFRIAHCADTACTVFDLHFLDQGERVGWDTAISIGVDGLPIAAYVDGINMLFTTVHCANAFCVPYFRRP